MRKLALCLFVGLLGGSLSVAHATGHNGSTPEHATGPQQQTAPLPWLGKIIEVTYPIARFRLEFDRNGSTMRFRSLDDPTLEDTVQYSSRQVKPGIHALQWYEPSYDLSAFQFQDWNTNTVHTALVLPSPEIQSVTGTFQVVGDVP